MIENDSGVSEGLPVSRTIVGGIEGPKDSWFLSLPFGEGCRVTEFLVKIMERG